MAGIIDAFTGGLIEPTKPGKVGTLDFILVEDFDIIGSPYTNSEVGGIYVVHGLELAEEEWYGIGTSRREIPGVGIIGRDSTVHGLAHHLHVEVAHVVVGIPPGEYLSIVLDAPSDPVDCFHLSGGHRIISTGLDTDVEAVLGDTSHTGLVGLGLPLGGNLGHDEWSTVESFIGEHDFGPSAAMILDLAGFDPCDTIAKHVSAFFDDHIGELFRQLSNGLKLPVAPDLSPALKLEFEAGPGHISNSDRDGPTAVGGRCTHDYDWEVEGTLDRYFLPLRSVGLELASAESAVLNQALAGEFGLRWIEGSLDAISGQHRALNEKVGRHRRIAGLLVEG